MKKYILLLLLIVVTDFALAQISTPNSYTTNYRIRKYAQGAKAGSDSLNANSDLIDATMKAIYDTAQTKGGKALTNTWTGSNTFSGTTILNSVVTTSKDIVPIVGGFDLGSWVSDWDRIFVEEVISNSITIHNSEGTDSATITLNDSTIDFDNKSLSFTADEITPSLSGKLGNDTTAFTKIFADSVISGESFLHIQGKQGGVEIYSAYGFGSPTTIGISAGTTTVDASGVSYIELTESEIVSGLRTFTAGANRREGNILRVVNSSNYAVTIKNGTGNIVCGSDIVLGQYDIITFVYYDIGGASYRWLRISNVDN